ncbi:Protein Wnt-4 [Fasciola hepatica]|uniref:Protein Wnt n=1 Tax=Fasciola hepatica TaxID=6192 RepID=A0A4E0RYG0_FASHE|nr:Protein Wnt-4 [Fasciola hepatica]
MKLQYLRCSQAMWTLNHSCLLLCYVLSFSSQLRELLATHQPKESLEPDMNDDLLVPGQLQAGSTKSEFDQPSYASPYGGNVYRVNATQSYWTNQASQTASMQRRLSMSSARKPDANFTASQLGLSYAHMWNQSQQTVAPVLHTEETTTDGFIGPDGKLQMSICNHPNGFLRHQKKLCRRYLHLMESVVRGYFMGLRECEYQFSAHRWNCQGHNLTLRILPEQRRRLRYRQSSANRDLAKRQPVRIKTYLDKLLSKGTRESAYVLAVTSAGVSHAVTKACSSGLHDNCGCDRTIYDHPREPNFEWSGCSDNIHFGAAFSRQFLDVRERSRLKRNPKLGMANLHNNHVGRQAVINKMEVQCKCHGVSGSCEMRTCWRSLPKFRDLGEYLQERFHQAILVDYIDKRLVPVDTVDHQLTQRSLFSKKTRPSVTSSSLGNEKPSAPTENDLIYISGSPTFCHHDPGFGSIGTYGRRCVEGAKGLNSCEYLCCNRGFKRETFVQEERCNCKFQWCCKVICQTCRKTVVVSTCN